MAARTSPRWPLHCARAADPATVRTLLGQWTFEEVDVEETPDGAFLVGTSCHLGDVPFPPDEQPLFVFTSGLESNLIGRRPR